MALIKCSECGKEISNKAISCPNCGYRIPPKKLTKLDKIFVPIISILIFAGIMGIMFSPSFIKYSYPNMKTYETYDNNGLIGYDANGNEIRGYTSHTNYDLGEMKKDSSNAIIVGVLSALVPTTTIVVYVILKKKEIKNEDV